MTRSTRLRRVLVLALATSLLACSDGLWSGINDNEIAEISTLRSMSLAENLKSLSMKALTMNAPYSDNTTGTALLCLGD